MLSNPPLHLRSALSSLKPQSSHLIQCSIAPLSRDPRQCYQLTPHRPISSTNPKTISSTLPPFHNRPTRLFTRSGSTTSSPPVTITTVSPTTKQPPHHQQPQLTSLPPNPTTLPWNEYLQLRRTRRYYNLVASVVTALCTTAGGISILSQQNIEALGGSIFGLDPFIVLGLATAGSGAVGWLLGPFIGNAVFSIVYRRLSTQIAFKDKDFYHRIQRYRVDPSSQSYSNPVPDYYGEKIGSVGEFRNWMKDQRAYNRKRQNFL